jgi:hypothetical protein
MVSSKEIYSGEVPTTSVISIFNIFSITNKRIKVVLIISVEAALIEGSTSVLIHENNSTGSVVVLGDVKKRLAETFSKEITKPKMAAAIIPGFTKGNVIFQSTCILLAPKFNAASSTVLSNP